MGRRRGPRCTRRWSPYFQRNRRWENGLARGCVCVCSSRRQGGQSCRAAERALERRWGDWSGAADNLDHTVPSAKESLEISCFDTFMPALYRCPLIAPSHVAMNDAITPDNPGEIPLRGTKLIPRTLTTKRTTANTSIVHQKTLKSMVTTQPSHPTPSTHKPPGKRIA
jgi:hypothetical protein